MNCIVVKQKLVSIIKTPRLNIDRLDELFIKFWTLEGAVTDRAQPLQYGVYSLLTNQIVSTMGAAITIWRFIPNDQSNRLPKFR